MSAGATDPAGEEAPGHPVCEERREDAPFPWYGPEELGERFPELVVGITGAEGTLPGTPGLAADFGLTTAPSPWELLERYEALAEQLGFGRVALVRQVHGARVVDVGRVGGGGARAAPAVGVQGAADGLWTSAEGVLLAVTAADCVPVYLVEPRRRAVALLHAGWRGVGEGILEAGLERFRRAGSGPEELHLHLGPAICGECYEVGTEVLEALDTGSGGSGEGRRTVDLRARLARRAAAAGVRTARIGRSGWCTRCAADHFHSHRGKGVRAGRMAAFLGWRAGASGA